MVPSPHIVKLSRLRLVDFSAAFDTVASTTTFSLLVSVFRRLGFGFMDLFQNWFALLIISLSALSATINHSYSSSAFLSARKIFAFGFVADSTLTFFYDFTFVRSSALVLFIFFTNFIYFHVVERNMLVIEHT